MYNAAERSQRTREYFVNSSKTDNLSLIACGMTAELLLAQGCALTRFNAAKTVDLIPADRPRKTLASAPVSATPTRKPLVNPESVGKASWYGPGFTGKKTASGAVFEQAKLTAAHRTLPLGSRAEVTNLENGKSVQVEINDRGPYASNRIIDLSRAAAHAIGMINDGVVQVRVDPLPRDHLN
jgi:rare lipoprotein A